VTTRKGGNGISGPLRRRRREVGAAPGASRRPRPQCTAPSPGVAFPCPVRADPPQVSRLTDHAIQPRMDGLVLLPACSHPVGIRAGRRPRRRRASRRSCRCTPRWQGRGSGRASPSTPPAGAPSPKVTHSYFELHMYFRIPCCATTTWIWFSFSVIPVWFSLI
jgi:hypothetical protein